MRVRLVERDIEPAWCPALVALTTTTMADVSIVRRESLVAMPPDDFYIWVGRSLSELERELTALGNCEPERCSRTIVLGLPLDFVFGQLRSAPGTLIRLLETHALAGAFGPESLTSWQEAPSSFAGPKGRMYDLAISAVKAFQTRTYANWFGVRGATLADFLFDYLRAIEKESSRRSEPAATPEMTAE